jgi:drug/metabolite transporter (DMT)-like permease
VVLLGAIPSLTRPKWLGARDTAHSVVVGLLVHGLGLRDVFVSIENGLSAGMVALVFSRHPALTSTIANRWLGEHVRLLQWVGLALGILGIYLIVRDRGDHRHRHSVRMGAASVEIHFKLSSDGINPDSPQSAPRRSRRRWEVKGESNDGQK